MNEIESKYSDHPLRGWFIKQSIVFPLRTILVSLIFTIVAASGVRFFMIDDDMMKILPKELDSRISWDIIQEEFGSTEVIFIAFGKKDESIFNQDALASLWDVGEQLEATNEVEEITSISTITRMDNLDGFMEVDDLQPYRDVTLDEVEDIRLYLEKNPTIKKRFVSEDDEYFMMMVQPYTSDGLNYFRDKVVSIADPILSNYDIYYGGQAYVTGTMPAMIRDDVIILARIGILIMVTILLINLRSIAAVGMVIMVIGLSLFAMIGSMGWIYYLTGSDRFLFTLANTSMPIILLTIANSDGVHVVSKFFKELRIKKDTKSAVASTMDSLLIPIFLTSITTIAAFGTLTLSPLEPLFGYGIIIGIGIAWAWLLSSFLLPSVITLKSWNLKSNAISKPSFFEKIINKLGKVVFTHPKYIFSIGAFFVLIGLTGLSKVIVDVNMTNFFKPGTEIRDTMDFMDNKMTGTVDIRVRVEGDMKDPKTLSSMRKLQKSMEKDEKVLTSFSIANVVEQMHRTVMDDDPDFEVVPDDRKKVNNLFTMYSMSGDPDDFSTLIDYEYEVGLITAFSKVMTTKEIFAYVNEMNNQVKAIMNPNLSVDFTGMIVILRDLVIMVVRSSALSIIFSLIIIGIIASIFFKRILWGILAVVPLSSAVIINFGFMGYFGIELSHITALLSSVIIGVGVDFAIHYISQYRRLSRTSDIKKLSRNVVDDVGYPIILDAASNMGFGALLFSAFVPIQYIGGLMVFAMVSTSLGTLTVLAASTELMKNRLVNKG
ncbi:MAG: MMPL family transporter [Candidatus Neomarinimicrobiota bacterium]|jgi:predicted RND superfamily exporter protein|nr:MMPL family transporter [Candidatus Neomarinimicrobiota bacterium]|tara:strand:- start:8929 stop:11244 length:2316 start_codon:yes stop_codon:yes gene_type:complete